MISTIKEPISPILINNTYDKVHLLNQVNEKIPRCGTIEPKTINNYAFCYQCCIDVPDLFFGNLMNGYKVYETFIHVKTIIVIYKACMKNVFKKTMSNE